MKSTRYLIISFLLCSACRQDANPGLAQMTTLIKSLDRSNDFISWQIDKIDLSLQNRSFDPYTAEKTKIWLPGVDAVRKLFGEMHIYLNGLRSALKTQAHIVPDTIETSRGWEDKDAVYELFEKTGRKKELSGKIAAYHKAISNAWNPDSMLVPDVIKEDIRRDIPKMITNVSESLVRGFDPANTTTAMTYIILDQIENDLLLTEHEMIRYADVHTNITRDTFEKFSFLVGVNSSYLKAGQTLTIDAGMGGFSLAWNPTLLLLKRPSNIPCYANAHLPIFSNNNMRKILINRI